MIEVTGLHHRYGPLTAVEEITFTVERGEVLGLLGPNGAGKTTVMRSVVGLLSPTAGSVRIDGHDHRGDSLAARSLLGYLPESVPLYRELRVHEFLSFAARAKGVAPSRVASEVERLLQSCGLESVASRLIAFCSRGFRQRIGLAQALAGDPPVLVLDEPTVGLDPGQIVEIRETIAELARNKAVLFSTHILPEANLLCSRVLIMHQGRAVAEDTPEKLGESGDGPVWMRILLRHQPSDLADQLRATRFVRAVVPLPMQHDCWQWRLQLERREQIADLVAELVRAGCAVEEVGGERAGLEEAFLRLVGQDHAKGTAE
jgi:ABC-2 type transport system ATP-binding protein